MIIIVNCLLLTARRCVYIKIIYIYIYIYIERERERERERARERMLLVSCSVFIRDKNIEYSKDRLRTSLLDYYLTASYAKDRVRSLIGTDLSLSNM